MIKTSKGITGHPGSRNSSNLSQPTINLKNTEKSCSNLQLQSIKVHVLIFQIIENLYIKMRSRLLYPSPLLNPMRDLSIAEKSKIFPLLNLMVKMRLFQNNNKTSENRNFLTKGSLRVAKKSTKTDIYKSKPRKKKKSSLPLQFKNKTFPLQLQNLHYPIEQLI